MISSVVAIVVLSVSCVNPREVDLSDSSNYDRSSMDLEEYVVTARRSKIEIGIQKIELDSAKLKENIALDMGDVLAYNSSLFVKSSGKASLSTISFRGTSPSHTQVKWNGLKINSPMLGMTDFSTIPAYFIDETSLSYGTSSILDTGGGLGGLVNMSNDPSGKNGWHLNYIQGIGSFSTFDEYLSIGYGKGRWESDTRFALSSSQNDFRFKNHDKKENIYDENHNIVGQYYPVEKNRSGAYMEFNALENIYYSPSASDKLGLNIWARYSDRELPMLTTDYADEREFDNSQYETDIRSSFKWNHVFGGSARMKLIVGYSYMNSEYIYKRETQSKVLSILQHTFAIAHTGMVDGILDWNPGGNLYTRFGISADIDYVRSIDKASSVNEKQSDINKGYSHFRPEISLSSSLRWQPIERLGTGITLRGEMAGKRWAPIPAFFADLLLIKEIDLTLMGSIGRNYRFPTLNDLYFLPGGNPDLKSEKGFNYNFSLTTCYKGSKIWSIGGSLGWFDSKIEDWILWLPNPRGYFSPRNIKDVHSYGVEANVNVNYQPGHDWILSTTLNYSWTPSVNVGEPVSAADTSVGHQLPYIPLHSAAIRFAAQWRGWEFIYKWNYYSKRYTMSGIDQALSDTLPTYFMSDISLGKRITFHWGEWDLKVIVRNLLNEDYQTILSRPMPGTNFEFFIGFSPKF